MDPLTLCPGWILKTPALSRSQMTQSREGSFLLLWGPAPLLIYIARTVTEHWHTGCCIWSSLFPCEGAGQEQLPPLSRWARWESSKVTAAWLLRSGAGTTAQPFPLHAHQQLHDGTQIQEDSGKNSELKSGKDLNPGSRLLSYGFTGATLRL